MMEMVPSFPSLHSLTFYAKNCPWTTFLLLAASYPAILALQGDAELVYFLLEFDDNGDPDRPCKRRHSRSSQIVSVTRNPSVCVEEKETAGGEPWHDVVVVDD